MASGWSSGRSGGNPNKQPIDTVANLNYHFFARSETFIYSYLTHMTQFHPIALSLTGPATNIDKFPFPADDIYGIAHPNRFTPRWLAGGLTRRGRSALGLEPVFQWRGPISWATRIVKERGGRLLHAHFGPVGARAVSIGASLDIPVVTTFYGFDLAPDISAESDDWAARRQELFDNGDLFLVEGPAMRAKLIALGCPAEKVEIQRIAVDLASLRFEERSMPSDGRAKIVFAGRLYEKKGLVYALEALAMLRATGRKFEFRVIGDGELRRVLRETARSYDLDGCVRWLGFLDYSEYVKEMSSASIFIHPSVTAANGDSEGGAPTVLLEAQAMGIPVVSTCHADIPNVTAPGSSALLSPERDSEALADSLAWLMDHPDRWPEMGAAGRTLVEARHDIRKEAPELERKYSALLGLSTPAPQVQWPPSRRASAR